ncbi:MAG TPA: hypothetical protein VGO63_02810 [Candidatus Paceibacterota bacterium]|jgi:hypothetical protein|nr:hypothetical protein [Candidatus Paceibacterota bacterium]
MKKFLPYILILIIAGGFFTPMLSVQAENEPPGTCTYSTAKGDRDEIRTDTLTETECKNIRNGTYISWVKNTPPTPTAAQQTDAEKKAAEEQEQAKTEALFGKCSLGSDAIIEGCIIRFFFLIFITLGSKILYMTAYIFNIMLSLTLSTVLYKSNFLPEAWRIIRDFSNIFFIMVLLYIAIKMILGLGGAEIKKMIVQVIVAALLINFSMFMTEVVIDSSNILALIFYNKISVHPPTATAKAVGAGTSAVTGATINDGGIPYLPATDKNKTQVEEKDIAGGIVAGFNPTNFLNPTTNKDLASTITTGNYSGTGEAIGGYASYFSGPCLTYTLANGAASQIGIGLEKNPCTYLGQAIGGLISSDEKKLPASVALAIIFTGGAVFLFAAWAFFVAGLAFIGRLIELWILIIFSPFAFMSLSIPQLKSLDYLGWDAWLKRLISIAFMAPVFMFFLLIISKLVQINILGNLSNGSMNASVTRTLIMLSIPALIYITMLHKATEYAKKGSGDFGEAVIKYGKMAGGVVAGLALTAASGGATKLIGGGVGALANKAAGAAEKAGFTGTADRLRGTSDFLRNRSFDPRALKVFGSLESATGIKFGKAKEGGWNEMKKKQEEKRMKRAEVLEKRGTAAEKKAVDNAENDINQKVLTTEIAMVDRDGNAILGKDGKATIPLKLALETFDKQMEAVRKDIDDAMKAGNDTRAEELGEELETVKTRKKTARTNAGLPALEKARDLAKAELDVKSNKIRVDYTQGIQGGLSKVGNLLLKQGAYSLAGADEAARKILAGTKVDSGEKPK